MTCPGIEAGRRDGQESARRQDDEESDDDRRRDVRPGVAGERHDDPTRSSSDMPIACAIKMVMIVQPALAPLAP